MHALLLGKMNSTLRVSSFQVVGPSSEQHPSILAERQSAMAQLLSRTCTPCIVQLRQCRQYPKIVCLLPWQTVWSVETIELDCHLHPRRHGQHHGQLPLVSAHDCHVEVGAWPGPAFVAITTWSFQPDDDADLHARQHSAPQASPRSDASCQPPNDDNGTIMVDPPDNGRPSIGVSTLHRRVPMRQLPGGLARRW